MAPAPALLQYSTPLLLSLSKDARRLCKPIPALARDQKADTNVIPKWVIAAAGSLATQVRYSYKGAAPGSMDSG